MSRFAAVLLLLVSGCSGPEGPLTPEIAPRPLREFSGARFSGATAAGDTLVLVFGDSTYFLSVGSDLSRGRSQPSVEAVVTQVASSGYRTVVRTRGERVYFSDRGSQWSEWRTPITDSVDVGSDYVSAWFYEDLEYAEGAFWLATEKGQLIESVGDDWSVVHIVDSGVWTPVVWDVTLFGARGVAVTSAAISERIAGEWEDEPKAADIDCFLTLVGINSSASVVAGGANGPGCVFLKAAGSAEWHQVTPRGLRGGLTRAAKDALGRVAFWNSLGDLVLLDGGAIRHMRVGSPDVLRAVQPLDDGRIAVVHASDDAVTLSLLEES